MVIRNNRLTDIGGDGIFIRVLNGWVSTGNVFVENDCSYANNNCVEAWSPRSTWIRNKANHGSYGFWLGASDQTRLEGNVASYNGDPAGHHNSPHLPGAGHAGIVFMFGPSSHTIARGNTCVGNNGAGSGAIDLAAAALFFYLPLGKLKHLVYFFAARYQLGIFYGRRGVWPARRD